MLLFFRALKGVGRNVWVTITPLLSLLAEKLLENLGQDKNALHLQYFLTVLQMCIYYLDRRNYSFNMYIFIYIYAYIYSEKVIVNLLLPRTVLEARIQYGKDSLW